MELHTEWHFACGESGHHIARFGIPQFNVAIVGGGQEVGAPVVPRNVLDGLPMSGEGANASSLAIDLPQLHTAVHRAGEQQMSGLGEPAN